MDMIRIVDTPDVLDYGVVYANGVYDVPSYVDTVVRLFAKSRSRTYLRTILSSK